MKKVYTKDRTVSVMDIFVTVSFLGICIYSLFDKCVFLCILAAIICTAASILFVILDEEYTQPKKGCFCRICVRSRKNQIKRMEKRKQRQMVLDNNYNGINF
jgi:hypothetical protein